MAASNDTHHIILTSFQDEYEETNDPIWAWHAIDFCSNWQRKTGQLLAYPTWVQDYLSMVADSLLKLPDNQGEIQHALGTALGIAPRSISDSIQTIRDKVLFFDIQSQMKSGSGLEEAIEQTAKRFTLSPDVVQNIYERFSSTGRASKK
jgi:hypothetical protein